MVTRVAVKRLGWVTQPRMSLYSATFGLLAAIYALGDHQDIAEGLLLVAIVCYVASFVGAARVRKICLDHYLSTPDQVYTIDDDGVSIHDEQTDVRVRWGHFDAAFETPTYFVLRHCANAIGLPKRAFAETDLAAVRAEITARMTLTPATA